MSGLILGGIGKGLSDAGSQIAGLMYKGIASEEDRADRAALRMYDIQQRAADKEADRELRREIADNKSANGSGQGGQGGLALKDINEGGAAEGIVARQAGMTVPELRQLRRSSQTGDMSSFMQTSAVEDESGGHDVTSLPPGFEKEYKAKLKALAAIEESYALGGKYDDVQKGRRTGQQIDATARAEANPGQAGLIGQAMAVGEGKDIIGGDSNVTRNKFTGETKVTPVGQSVITENNAQAANAGKTQKNNEFQGLQQERLALDNDLKRAEDAIKNLRKDTPKGWQDSVKEQEAKIARLEADKKLVTDRLRSFTQSESERGRGNPKPDTPKPETPKPQPPKPSDNSNSGESSASSSAKPAGDSKTPPSIDQVKGAPAGSTIGTFVQGKGWAVKDKSGKLVGYVR